MAKAQRWTGGPDVSTPGEVAKCPYCKTICTVQPERDPKYVNGLKPVSGPGCEFCNP